MSSTPVPVKKKYQGPFTEPGITEYEIEIEFQDDNRKLYVSKGFLSYISPVFKAMFSSSSDFKEKRENKILMKEKKYDNMLQFLRHFHPEIKAPITGQNVYTLVPLVQEYMNEDSLKKCKEVLKTMVKGYATQPNEEESIRGTLRVLHLAIDHDFSDIREFTVETLANWNTTCWVNRCFGMYDYDSFSEIDERRVVDENRSLYQSLPASTKIELLEQRFLKKENDQFFRLLLK